MITLTTLSTVSKQLKKQRVREFEQDIHLYTGPTTIITKFIIKEIRKE